MNILVTGAKGQLGQEITLLAASSHHHYILTDIDSLDICSPSAIEQMFRKHHIQLVINCAAYTQVDAAEDNKAKTEDINHRAVENLANTCKKHYATLIHISTDYVFSGTKNTPYNETDPTEPLSIYGKTKLAGENAIIDSRCKHIIIRTAWLYSSFGNNFVHTILRLTSERDKLQVVFDQVGSPTYAFDLAQFILHIIHSEQLDKKGIYHYSNEGVCTWYDFAKEIASATHRKCDITPCLSNEYPTKVKRPHYSVLDKTKAKSVFGVHIPHWKDALHECLKKIHPQTT